MIEERVTEYEVSLLPRDYPEGYLWLITVRRRSGNLWGIYWQEIYCLGTDGQWDYEGAHWTDSGLARREGEEWVKTHRFPLEQAIVLAREAAQTVGIHSHRDGRFMTAKDVLERDREEK